MVVLTKTKIKQRIAKKTNPELVQALTVSLKHPAWREVSKQLSSSSRHHSTKNLFEIDEEAKAGDTIVIVGKILSKGELTKKVRLCALSISEKAKEKIKVSKSEIVSLHDEIAKNPKAEGIKILR